MAMWIGEDENFILQALITLVIASIATFIATIMIGFEDPEENKEEQA